MTEKIKNQYSKKIVSLEKLKKQLGKYPRKKRSFFVMETLM